MKRHRLAFVFLFALVLAACRGRPDLRVAITSPADGSVIVLAADVQQEPGASPVVHWLPGYIRVNIGDLPAGSNSPCTNRPFAMWEFRDNGQSLTFENSSLYSCIDSAGGSDYALRWEPSTLGQHVLSLRFFVNFDPNHPTDSAYSYEYDSGEISVCVVNDPRHPVEGLPMGNAGSCVFPPTLTFTTFPPTFTHTPTRRPTFTPVTPIPVQPNPNQHGEGCGQYTDQLSCNLAACSWTGSACTVNP